MPWRDILLNAIRRPAGHWAYTTIPAERATPLLGRIVHRPHASADGPDR
jgi:hypothetical protein